MYSRDNKIMRKLLGKPTPDNSTDTANGLGITSSANSVPSAYRPSASQDSVYPAGVPILSFDTSPDRRTAILGGRHILKTVRLDGLAINEGIDIRAAIASQPASTKTSSGSSTSDQLLIKDVKWHGDSTIFTACANGKIFSYDLVRLSASSAGLDFAQTREDNRQINTLDINPHRGSYLLSGSQDGLVRCFDIRMPFQNRAGGGLTYRPVQAFKCNADGVRHIKWSPKDGFYFACGTEAGIVLKWDIRKASGPILKISGHDTACSSVSWHPDGEHLISGGRDNKCNVWDMSKTAEKRQKPKWTISTPAPVAMVTWRPGLWSATAQSRRAAQVAVSYDDSSNRRHGISAVHIWDLARPTLPFKEVDRFDSSPTALMWHGQDILWTAGQDGLFNQCDIAFAPKVIDRQSLSSIAFSARGDVAMFLDERPNPQRQRPHLVLKQDMILRPSLSSSPTTPMLSISRSDSEEDVVGSFLGPRRKVGRHRRPSTRSVPSIGTATPTSTISDDRSLTLDQALKLTGIFKTQQSMALGHLPAATKVHVYQYLASQYLEGLQTELPCAADGRPMIDRITSVMEHYARAAENVSLFRLAQTWRVLRFAIDLLLKSRAQFHLDTRLGLFENKSNGVKPKLDEKIREKSAIDVRIDGAGEETPRKSSSSYPSGVYEGRSLTVRSLLSEEIESTSNMPTPLARPVSDHTVDQNDYLHSKSLEPRLPADGFALPPAAHPGFSSSPRHRLGSEPISVMSHESGNTQISSTEGYDFYDTESLSRAIDVPGQKKPEKVPLDYGPRTPSRKLVRHDSTDSYGQMFSISSGSRQATNLTSSSDGQSDKRAATFEVVAERDEENESETGEYESRIRGKELEDSPERFAYSASRRQQQLRTDSPEEVFMISQTTMTSDTLTSIPSQSSQHGTDLHSSGLVGSPALQSYHNGVSPVRESASNVVDTTPTIVETDYLPWKDDPPYPFPASSQSPSQPPFPSPPLDPYTLITRALDFESRTSALSASAIILLLKPLVPRNLIDPLRATAILRQHHSRLMGMRLFVEAALLRKLCVAGWPEGLPQWGENYPSIFGPAQQSVKVGFSCSSCHKPRELDPAEGEQAIWRCERCRAVMAPCAVCGHREGTVDELVATTISEALEAGKPEPEPVLATWWYCPGCGHGGHATCLQGWHTPTSTAETVNFGQEQNERAGSDAYEGTEYSDGCCPLDGCGHACLPGHYRMETSTTRSEEVGWAAVEKTRASSTKSVSVGERKVSGGGGMNSPRMGSADSRIRSDSNEVPQSRAVESVREALATGSPGSLPSSSPGRNGVERERRKSVKFVPPER
jgi:WD repeat-containing protein 24